MKLLLHACCAPCTVGTLGIFGACAGIFSGTLNNDVTLFWYNPNIHPFTEYKSRRDSLFSFAEENKYPLIARDDYGLRKFIAHTAGDIDNRCDYCYEERFDAAARIAAENDFDAFSTTLLVSPYQKHEKIIEICTKMFERYGVAFFYRDCRPGFRDGQKKAREMGVYMQKYCGCIFSEEERFCQL